MKIHGRDSQSGLQTQSKDRNEIRRWLQARELGHKSTLGLEDRLSRQLYASVETTRTWDPMETTNHQHHGGIFNFDFSKDGSVLVAACEKQSVLMFDPLNGKLIASKDQAHSDCVNCVRFLDSRLFATCSDDTTVTLWDIRYIKHKVRTLTAHSNWVKNIEFDVASGLLVTSGFDGSVFTWDINKYSESEESYKHVFHTPGLMRMKLTPDASKLVVATGSGYLMVIHDLDLSTLSQDLDGFVPNMYRVMQETNTPIPEACENNHVFTQRKNRVELISDFPAANKADMIASLEVHPQGWCVVSRNTSTFDASEWTCVHDIQALDDNDSDCESLDQLSSNREMPLVSINDEDMAHRNRQDAPSDVRSNSDSTEPSRTGSPAFVLSISINERTGSPPIISQTYSTTTGTDSLAALASTVLENEVDSLLGDSEADLLASRSVQFDLSLPVTDGQDIDNAEVEEEVLQRSHEQQTQASAPHSSTNMVELAPPIPPDSNFNSSVLNVSNSPPSSSSPPLLSSSSSSENSLFVEHTTRQTPPTPLRRVRRQHLSTLDVLPRLHVHPSPSSRSTFQARWDNPNDLAFMPPPLSSFSTSDATLPRHSVAPLSTGYRFGESMTVLFRSSRHERLLLSRENTSAKPRSGQLQPYIYMNHQRLTHYTEELNVGRGFIKEVAFSGDGRLICSPFSYGVRLLGFDSSCSEMCDVAHNSPVKLYEVASTRGHQRSVVTTKFSPLHCMFVSGCLAGKINFNQPRL